MINSRILRRTLATTCLLAALSLGGCGMWSTGAYRPGGAGYSDDTYTYVSESWAPTNVTLIDTRTGQTLWAVEIPVGQQCVMRFYRGAEPDNEVLPDTMRWQLMTAGRESGELYSIAAVPPASGRRVDVSLRRAPEMPSRPQAMPVAAAGVQPAPAPAPRPANREIEPTPMSPAQDPLAPPPVPTRKPAPPAPSVIPAPEPRPAAPSLPSRRKIPVP